MRPLHICFVSQEYPPETGWGGIGAYTYEIAHGLARAGQRVSVISLALDGETVTHDGGVEVHRIAAGGRWGRYRGLWRLHRLWPNFAQAAATRLRAIHAGAAVDIVEAAECRADGLFLSLLPGGPRVIVRLHKAWIFVDQHNGILPDWRKRLIYLQEALSIRAADLVTAPSQAMVELTRSWISLSRQRVRVVPNPVNGAIYSPATAPPPTEEILFVGRLEVNKGSAVLEQAVPRILQRRPAASFRIVGQDSPAPCGRTWRQRLLEAVPPAERGRLHFEQTSRTELIERYRQASLCLLPSLWENFPYAVLEAMACGVPVVASRTGGVVELVDDGATGILVPSSDPAAVTEAVCALLADPQRLGDMSRAARARVEQHFRVEAVVPQMLDLYRAVREGGNP